MANKLIHPLETLLDIEEGSTDLGINIEEHYAVATEEQTQVPATVEKDEEDKEVDAKIDTVYAAAMDAFQTQTSYTEIIEPRYAARNAEVAANYLNIALAAATSRAKIKTDRKKTAAFVPFNAGGKTTNNLIVADRNDILRMIQVDDEKKELK